ncbi:MAG: methyltransferase domain-containing protein [Saprospiraceae bacterium]|nr:class I SAM-dependent methyltransferase [Lewinella sp.]
MNKDWKEHYQYFGREKTPPSATLQKALNLFAQEKLPLKEPLAIDLGCGTGIDTSALLMNGWSVLAIDQEQRALQQLANIIPPSRKEALTTKCSTFESLTRLPACSLVNASFSLPFCRPGQFDDFWSLIVNCLLPNGRFAGHLFGINDSWSDNPNMSFHEIHQIKTMFSGFELEVMKEINKPGKTVSGKTKHWHVFHIIAKKNALTNN